MHFLKQVQGMKMNFDEQLQFLAADLYLQALESFSDLRYPMIL